MKHISDAERLLALQLKYERKLEHIKIALRLLGYCKQRRNVGMVNGSSPRRYRSEADRKRMEARTLEAINRLKDKQFGVRDVRDLLGNEHLWYVRDALQRICEAGIIRRVESRHVRRGGYMYEVVAACKGKQEEPRAMKGNTT